MSWIEQFIPKKESFKNLDYKRIVKEYGLIALGTFIMAVGFVIFISPLKLAPGGVYGIAIILHHLFNFPIGLSGICLDLPLLIIGTLWLGPKFGAKTLFGIVTLSGFISILEFTYGYDPLIPISPDMPSVPDPSANFIIALCGGVLLGVGLGLIFKSRATSGGTDIIASIIAKYVKHIPIGTILMIVDSIIVLVALVAFNDWTVPLYSWLIIYVTGVVIDKVIAGYTAGKALLIISDKHEQIKDEILNKMHRGGTYLKAEGMYSGRDKKIIYTTLTSKEIPGLVTKVHHIDPEAFISIVDVAEALGEGFTPLEERAL